MKGVRGYFYYLHDRYIRKKYFSFLKTCSDDDLSEAPTITKSTYPVRAEVIDNAREDRLAAQRHCQVVQAVLEARHVCK